MSLKNINKKRLLEYITLLPIFAVLFGVLANVEMEVSSRLAVVIGNARVLESQLSKINGALDELETRSGILKERLVETKRYTTNLSNAFGIGSLVLATLFLMISKASWKLKVVVSITVFVLFMRTLMWGIV